MAKKKKKVTTVTETVTKTVTVTSEPEKTHVICVLDSSFSMSGIMEESIEGFNTFLKEQKELPDDATITVAIFDSEYELLYDFVPIKEAKYLDSSVWYPRGMTALYDAIGQTINTDRAKIKKLGPDGPAKVLVCVVTDGHENRSREYQGEEGRKAIAKLIKDCEKDDWNFVYLAANQDAFAVGGSFGISAGNTVNYVASAAGTLKMSKTLSNVTASYRGMSTTDAMFSVDSKNLVSDEDKDNVVNDTLTTDNNT